MRHPLRVVLLDAYGTLVILEPPVPLLQGALAAEGFPYDASHVGAALAAEVAYYRAHHDDGFDAPSLAALRLRCATVLGDALGHGHPPLPRLAEVLRESLRFRLFDDVIPALDALHDRGIALAVVSNWDCSLPDVLESLGIHDRFQAIVVSAIERVAKPDPALFRRALAAVGARADEAVHCGDLPDVDGAGAATAGVEAVIIDRDGRQAGVACRTIGSLAELVDYPTRLA